MKYYAIKRPDGSYIMAHGETERSAWCRADDATTELKQYRNSSWIKDAEAAGYRCVEVDGFREVEK